MSVADKVQSRHCDRLAIVYVRQSTLQQVERHQESTRLQYGLVERALQFGWSRERVVVIDDDLGRSGAAAAMNPGFQRLVAEVGLGRVGLVLGVEMSRLARSCRDWHQLLEICAVFDTLLADTDGVYDPGFYNDRLLLGLKGTMSEAELHLLKGRMLAGRRAKAERGELLFNLPRGYVRTPAGAIASDPDEQVQATIRLVFDVFERRRTINGVLRYLVDHQVHLPHRVRSGAARGELEWHRPNRYTLSEMLRNPIYAGAYTYGRRAIDPRRQVPGRPDTGRVAAGAPAVLIKDRVPAYMSWDSFERNQAQVAANRSQHEGIARGGPALLAGLLVCGRCGQRMVTQYPNRGRFLRYSCSRLAVNYGAAACQSLSGHALDALVAGLMLEALQPAALEVTLQLLEDLELERAALHRQWQQRLERARYEVERARRQYDAVEPENRLVARTLEQRWEEALSAELRLTADYDHFLADQPRSLTPDEQVAIRRLADDIPALWTAPSTTAADRQAIARLMLERVVITVAGTSEKVAVVCHWAGGVQTHHSLRRPVARGGARFSAQHPCRAAAADRRAACCGHEAAGDRRGAQRRGLEAGQASGDVHRRNGARSPASTRGAGDSAILLGGPAYHREPAELTISEVAARLAMPANTVHRWVQRGVVRARKVKVMSQSLWLIHADDAELARLRGRRNQSSVNQNGF